ncbi:uncharacterized protein PGTG_18762 [Puccinia graminis f. sp. tritici CRL 75-36-700-3]|uniref:DUF4218 domain-containing protein n=1 Tax=Puccinia graminis f. sp. tritici (strain CRL 75-36-700-3 / race SCCL) TaxID=418459 RepID=E3L868_PUCGT|nr:uncharacterized protein PGTG_18762 [Puccinia graminis f. sp. tritici CRL 75-36-700-3]EFP92743.2 hypothetical protein PGTG_18762 [Puccinia graminis f. sp. tritici CRL 75-36-700-3]
MGQIIVPEMNKISSEGFDAYDVSLSEEVLVMTSVFSFLGDSPMHAEVTSTPVPSAALNPCRFCVLSAPSLLEKSPNKHRHWPQMIEDSKKIWNLAKEKKSEKKSDELSIKCGVRDQLNRHFASEIYQSKRLKKKLKKNKETIPDHLKSGIPQHIVDLEKNDPTDLFNPYSELEGVKVPLDITPFSEVEKLILVVVIPGFDGTIHTPVEILHVFLLGMVKYLFRDFMNSLKPTEKDELIGLWRSFETDALNIPSLKPVGLVKYYSSLIGKDFKVIVQAAPFLFFQFMDGPRKNIWHALCHLAPLVFQTHITDMDEFLSELKIRIDTFLYHIIKSSAQWINKPKFHMLLHLPESIRLYGPATLFATEKFESYNGIMRNASVHSNRHSPGHDIAITFSSYHSFRQILSGSTFYDSKKKTLTKASTQVTDVFTLNPNIQTTFGYNYSTLNPTASYPSIRKENVSKADILAVPEDLRSHYLYHHIHKSLR